MAIMTLELSFGENTVKYIENHDYHKTAIALLGLVQLEVRILGMQFLARTDLEK